MEPNEFDRLLSTPHPALLFWPTALMKQFLVTTCPSIPLPSMEQPSEVCRLMELKVLVWTPASKSYFRFFSYVVKIPFPCTAMLTTGQKDQCDPALSHCVRRKVAFILGYGNRHCISGQSSLQVDIPSIISVQARQIH